MESPRQQFAGLANTGVHLQVGEICIHRGCIICIGEIDQSPEARESCIVDDTQLMATCRMTCFC